MGGGDPCHCLTTGIRGLLYYQHISLYDIGSSIYNPKRVQRLSLHISLINTRFLIDETLFCTMDILGVVG